MRIIVGYTDTPEGTDALALGVTFAQSLGASLNLVIVLHSDERPTLTPPDAGYERHLRSTADGWLADARATIPADVENTGQVVYAESFSEGILDASKEAMAQLIVVGAAKGGLLGRMTVGSVANDLLHAAVVPVALAPAGYAQKPDRTIDRITAAVGRREGADALLDAAIIFSRTAAEPLRLLSLVALDLPTGERQPDALARAEQHAKEVLEYATAHMPSDVPVVALTASGSRIEDAVSAVGWEEGEVVLVGSSRLAQRGQIFLGATAAKMLRTLPVPMVVVPRDSVLTVEKEE